MKQFCLSLCLVLFIFSCSNDEKSELALVFKLKYDGDPVVMFDSIEYPTGMKMAFTRFSFYISDLQLGGEELKNIDYLDLTDSHESLEKATKGFFYRIDNLAPALHQEISFNIGVPEDQNSKDPEDFPSSSALSRLGEYWPGWNSYIFLKMEGNYDSDEDGLLDSGFALHLGADDAFMSFEEDIEIQLIDGMTTYIEVSLDLKDMFSDEDNLYDFLARPRIHSPSHNAEVIDLSKRIKKHLVID